MLKIFFTSTLLFLMSCEGAHFKTFEEKPVPSAESIVADSLNLFAEGSSQCREQKIALVKDNIPRIKAVVGQLKNIALGGKTHLNTKQMARHYTQKTEDEQLKEIIAIVTSDGFRTVLGQVSDVIRDASKNEVILGHLETVLGSFYQESGDRLAEILTDVSIDPVKQASLFGALHTALCDEATEQDILGALLSPEVLWTLGPNVGYLITSDMILSGKAVAKAVQAIELPEELKQFIELAKQMMPQQNLTERICSMDVNNYQKHFKLIATLFQKPSDAKQPRPLRSLLNMFSSFYTLEESNGCVGTRVDELKQTHIKNAFLMIADFIKHEETGLVGFLQKMKPRS